MMSSTPASAPLRMDNGTTLPSPPVSMQQYETYSDALKTTCNIVVMRLRRNRLQFQLQTVIDNVVTDIPRTFVSGVATAISDHDAQLIKISQQGIAKISDLLSID
ncbi:hypothetical protein J6590_098469 [Homalodisca vitripennis]|nr:hypothetical protein J6590_098469 [Homalodisca vitripennis]